MSFFPCRWEVQESYEKPGEINPLLMAPEAYSRGRGPAGSVVFPAPCIALCFSFEWWVYRGRNHRILSSSGSFVSHRTTIFWPG